MEETVPDEVVYVGTQEALAAHLGVERKTIARWQKLTDCPGRAREGYDVPAWKAFVERNKLGRKPNKSKQDLDNEKLALQNEHLRLRNAKARGEVCTIGEVVQVLCEMVAGFSLTLKQSEYTIAEEASGVEVGEAVKRVKKRHHEALETLALGEWAQKKTFWSQVSAELSDRLKTLDPGPGPKTT